MTSPLFSRKAYVTIAKAVKADLDVLDYDKCASSFETNTLRSGMTHAVLILVEVFAADNANFDTDRFLAACGFWPEEIEMWHQVSAEFAGRHDE